MTTYYETQVITLSDGTFQMTVTIGFGPSEWTSKPVSLDSCDLESAKLEAASQTRKLAVVLNG